MVLEVENSLDDKSFISLRQQVQFAIEDRDLSVISTKLNARDTSTSPRDTLEELRHSHTSILNLTEDGEESDEDEASQTSFLFEDLNEPPRLEDTPASDDFSGVPKPLATCCPTERRGGSVLVDWIDNSTTNFRNATETLTESLCPASMMDEPCGNFRRYVASGGRDRSLQRQVEMDILELLGYSEEQTDEELAPWASPLLCSVDKPHVRPTPQTIKSRVQRVHRFRKERKGITNPVELRKNKSFDGTVNNTTQGTNSSTNVSTEISFHDALGSFLFFEEDLPIGLGLEPIQHSDQDGYDSDPGESNLRRQSFRDDEKGPRNEFQEPMVDMRAVAHYVETARPAMDIEHAVQESLNITWTLTWHPTPQTMNAVKRGEKSKKHFEPMCIQIWFERGHILHFGHTVIEPQVMWRSSTDPKAAMSTPFQLRMLNVCRALPVETLDRTKYPLARTSHSFVLRMIDGTEFVFEAASEGERNDILQRWKLVVARLATLAVFEDVDAMQKEFFSPGMDPQTLTFSDV